MGFAAPVGDWIRGPLQDFVCDTLLAQSVVDRGYFEPAAVRLLLERHLAGAIDHADRLWNLMMLEIWHREMVDAPIQQSRAVLCVVDHS
jgi:asparagine synthase (glutamine-hydrolysing)